LVRREPLTLCSLLGDHPNTVALKSGQVSSPLINFDYANAKVANTQFKTLVRDLKYDFGELAMVTFLQAATYRKPYVVLTATVVGRLSQNLIPRRLAVDELLATQNESWALKRSRTTVSETIATMPGQTVPKYQDLSVQILRAGILGVWAGRIWAECAGR
jgi:hypothetical protein